MTEDEYLLDKTQAEFDTIWSGRACGSCRCPKPIDTLVAAKKGARRPR